MLTIKKVNVAIQKHFPNVCLTRGEGYYYIYSDDKETALKIASLYSSGIYGVSRLNQLTIEQWVNEIKYLFKKSDWAGDSSGTDKC